MPPPRPLAQLAVATTFALLGASCSSPSPGPVVGSPPRLSLPGPVVTAPPSSPQPPSSSATPPAPTSSRSGRPSRSPTIEEIAAHASGICLARVERANGFLHFIVTEIWRADPGSRLAIGEEAQANRQRKDEPAMFADQVIVYNFSPYLVRADGARVSEGAASVFNGQVPAYKMSLPEVRAVLMSPRKSE